MKLAAFFLVFFSLSAVSAKRVSLRRAKGEAVSSASSSQGVNPTRRLSKGGKGKGGGGNPCDICYNGKPDSLSFRYELPAANSAYQPEDKASCRAYPKDPYPTSSTLSVAGSTPFAIENGTEFTLDGSFSANTVFTIGGWGDCTIHTSCSVPLIPGDKIGPFVVLGDEDCEVPDDECIICDSDNKIRPPFLTFIYKSDGKNSFYQDESKASCREDTYPVATTLTIDTKSGGEQIFMVSDGDTFEVLGEFDATTEIEISGWSGGSCTVHTSCSAPLVVGDQIGPFILIEGNECKLTSTPSYSPSYSPTESPSDPPTDSPSGSPTESPSESPSESPTESPTESPSGSPTDYPSESPTESPTASPSEPPTETPPCIVPGKLEYECGEDITVSFDYAFADTTEGMKGPLQDDWIGIYPCGNAVFKHSESWLWACAEFGENFMSCAGPASTGSVTFQDPMPAYNDPGPHTFPIAPFFKDGPGSDINTCFQAVLLRFDGPSVPPYVSSCLSAEFTINAGTSAECQVRPSSPAFDSNP
eukprot:CAMPEP_0119004094 /NCGR_PEP_ID=MMETSP1176-20130426/946_1 /TAXON_ID=265551 /ORGANISM="Synedropsis recta cf, Strain CCMP1620" /LENGTH=530 /DNA_ID=CAMNT_0006955765 /DNA_START=112 /DNA_END=1707 /DNA_ORIENTATION=-